VFPPAPQKEEEKEKEEEEVGTCDRAQSNGVRNHLLFI
jgi:hypothetical protein